VWYYLIGKPEGMACEVSEAELAGLKLGGRKLQSSSGGVSGTSGASGGGSDGGSDDASDGASNTKPPSTDGAVSARAMGPVLAAAVALAAAGSLQ
jgi:hypothetical protein